MLLHESESDQDRMRAILDQVGSFVFARRLGRTIDFTLHYRLSSFLGNGARQVSSLGCAGRVVAGLSWHSAILTYDLTAGNQFLRTSYSILANSVVDVVSSGPLKFVV